MKDYRGNILCLKYPEILQIKEKEPRWYAVGPKERTTAQILINPAPDSAAGFARLIRNPYFSRTPGAFIDREGHFSTAKGIKGHERIARLRMALSDVETWAWFVDALYKGTHVLNIQISVVESDWLGGTVWENFIDSIEILESASKQGEAQKISKDTDGYNALIKQDIKQDIKHASVLQELPKELHYLLNIAAKLDSISEDNLEDNPEVFHVLEVELKREMGVLTKEKAKIRIRTDRERLRQWLDNYPAEKFPETACLYAVLGALLYADGIFE